MEYQKGFLTPGWAGSHGDVLCRTGIPADQKHIELTPEKISFSRHACIPLGVTAKMSGTLSAAVPQAVTVKLTLYRNLPYVNLTVTVGQPRVHQTLGREACWLTLPLKVDRPQFRVGESAPVVNPATDFIPNSGRMAYWCNAGVAVFNDEGGVGWESRSTPRW